MQFDHEALATASKTYPSTKPIYMVFLSKYREHADYATYLNSSISVDSSPCTGREAMARYRECLRAIMPAGASKPQFMGTVAVNALVPEGEAWDDVVLVKFESLDVFRETVASAVYKREVEVHRFAGLESSRLILADGVVL